MHPAASRRRTTPPQDGGQLGNPPSSAAAAAPPALEINSQISASSKEKILDDYLVTKILLRLPPKSLIRFKSTCKKWLSLISSDDFCLRHTLRRPKLPPSLILSTPFNDDLYYLDPTEKSLTPYFPSTDPHYQIYQSCNGLLLLCSQYDVVDAYYVHNPTTMKSRLIKLPYIDDDYIHVAWIGLVFDPMKSPFYKILCIKSTTPAESYPPPPPPPPPPSWQNQIQNQGPYTYRIEVYNSEFHKWTVTEEPVTYPTRLFYSNGVHWDDAVYFGNSCFDLVRKEIKTVPFSYPQIAKEMVGAVVALERMQEFDGRLYRVMLGVKGSFEGQSVGLWEVGYGNASAYLFLKHQHLLQPHPATLTPWTNDISVLGFMDARTVLTCEVGKIRAHNFVERSYHDLIDLTKKDFYLRNYGNGTFRLIGFQVGQTLALV